MDARPSRASVEGASRAHRARTGLSSNRDALMPDRALTENRTRIERVSLKHCEHRNDARLGACWNARPGRASIERASSERRSRVERTSNQLRTRIACASQFDVSMLG